MLNKNLIKKIINFKLFSFVLITTIILATSCSKSSTEGETNLKIYFSANEYSVTAGNEVEVKVFIENAQNLFASSLQIDFNTAIAEYVESSIELGGFWYGNIIQVSVKDNDGLSICIGLEQSSANDGISGSGELFRFKISGLNVGISNLNISNLSLIKENGGNISGFGNITINNSSLIVE